MVCEGSYRILWSHHLLACRHLWWPSVLTMKLSCYWLMMWLMLTCLKFAVMQFVVHLSLQPLNDESDEEDNISSLKRPHLCCPPSMTVHHLCKVDHKSCWNERNPLYYFQWRFLWNESSRTWPSHSDVTIVQVVVFYSFGIKPFMFSITHHFTLSHAWSIDTSVVILSEGFTFRNDIILHHKPNGWMVEKLTYT